MVNINDKSWNSSTNRITNSINLLIVCHVFAWSQFWWALCDKLELMQDMCVCAGILFYLIPFVNLLVTFLVTPLYTSEVTNSMQTDKHYKLPESILCYTSDMYLSLARELYRYQYTWATQSVGQSTLQSYGEKWSSIFLSLGNFGMYFYLSLWMCLISFLLEIFVLLLFYNFYFCFVPCVCSIYETCWLL